MAPPEEFLTEATLLNALRAQGFTPAPEDVAEILLRTNALVKGLNELMEAHPDLPESLEKYDGWWTRSAR